MAEIINNITMAAFGFIAVHITLIHFLSPDENSSSSARPVALLDYFLYSTIPFRTFRALPPTRTKS